MANYKKRNSKKDAKTAEKDVEHEFERRRLEKWRPGNRNFP